jgi:hypothetical protein
MTGQDYDKDLYLLVVGSGQTTRDNWEDNVEDFIFGDRESREVTLVVPYTRDLGKGVDTVLTQWAVGKDRQDPNYPIIAFVEPEAGHKSISSAKESTLMENENGVVSASASLEAAMSYLVKRKLDDQEVAVIVIYDQNKDVELIGDIKNYNGIPVYNIDGMIDSFPGFKTTDEILEEERKREEFETKEAIRIAAEKEQEAAQKDPESPVKPPRKRAAKKVAATPEEKPLTARKTPATPKAVEDLLAEHPGGLDEFKVPGNPNDGVNRGLSAPSTFPKELEPVKTLPKVDETPDLWKDVSRAKAELGQVTHYSVRKESLAELSEGITEMALSFSKTMGALTKIIEGK